MTVYNKLVRDKIPRIIEESGQKPVIRILEQEEYRQLLHRKLDEEVSEFHNDQNAEELADILEVVYALAEDMGCSRQELMQVYDGKHAARGGFSERVFLIGKE